MEIKNVEPILNEKKFLNVNLLTKEEVKKAIENCIKIIEKKE